MQEGLVPWALDGAAPGARVLEIGPGYGAATELLAERVAHLTCVEIDGALASDLAARFAGRDIVVRHADATALEDAAGTYDTALCFTMLHHVPRADLQDRLFCEVARVLRPGGVFAGTDTVASLPLRLLHLRDTCVPLDPATVPDRLRAAGFRDARVDVRRHTFRFRAVR